MNRQAFSKFARIRICHFTNHLIPRLCHGIPRRMLLNMLGSENNCTEFALQSIVEEAITSEKTTGTFQSVRLLINIIEIQNPNALNMLYYALELLRSKYQKSLIGKIFGDKDYDEKMEQITKIQNMIRRKCRVSNDGIGSYCFDETFEDKIVWICKKSG